MDPLGPAFPSSAGEGKAHEFRNGSTGSRKHIAAKTSRGPGCLSDRGRKENANFYQPSNLPACNLCKREKPEYLFENYLLFLPVHGILFAHYDK